MPDLPATRQDALFRTADTGFRIPADRLTPTADRDPGTAVLGLVPFDRRRQADLLYRTDLPLVEGQLAPARDAATPVRVRSADPGVASRYTSAVRAAVELIDTGALDKVVLARAVSAILDGLPPWDVLTDRLVVRNPTARVFSVPTGPDAAFLGASPELLLRRRGDRVTSHPLAGSVPRSTDPGEDRRRAEGLSASEKDHREHAFVVDMIASVLAPYCAELSVPERPSLLSTDSMWHLGTRITGRLRTTPDLPDALTLARLLHPTPAVGGVPTGTAVDLIAALEPAPRGWFTGAAGWCDADGDGDWVVSIRSAAVDGDRLTAAAGAGIVSGSDPASEYRETGAKLRTVLAALTGTALTDTPLTDTPLTDKELSRAHLPS
jgi:isochorismate synthase